MRKSTERALVQVIGGPGGVVLVLRPLAADRLRGRAMTKTVELTRDLRPWHAGDKVFLPDDEADKLIAEGKARPVAEPKKPPPGRYLTRERRRAG